MSLSIATNVASLNAQRNLSASQFSLGKSMQRLSSGLRINTAADDCAGLAISENMRGQIRSTNQAMKNASDGISLIQTAEGALNETSAILIRMRELATQSATGTVGSVERTYIQGEMNKLSSEIDRIAESTEFNSQHVMNGILDGKPSGNGWYQALGNMTYNWGGLLGKVPDKTINTMTFQIGARNNAYNDTIDLNISDTSTKSIFNGKVDLVSDSNGVFKNVKVTGDSYTIALKVNDQTSAQMALDTLDAAIISISRERSNLGSTQNRLQSTINNLQVAVENTSAAESRIRDVDVASETAIMTRNNILTQAGTAILSQANQAPQAALSLLK